jgi:hypothetical protein
MCCYVQYVDVKCMLILHVELLDSEPYVVFVSIRAQVELRDHRLRGLRGHD